MDRSEIEGHVRELYTTFSKGSFEAIRELFAPGFVWHVPGNNPVSGAYEGHDEYFETMTGRMAPLDEWSFEVKEVEVNERDRAALVSFHLAGERKSRRIDTEGHHMIRLDDEGRIVEGWGFTLNQDELDSFFSA